VVSVSRRAKERKGDFGKGSEHSKTGKAKKRIQIALPRRGEPKPPEVKQSLNPEKEASGNINFEKTILIPISLLLYQEIPDLSNEYFFLVSRRFSHTLGK
jgi:hypothetical protein